jgi:hypothetical protein
MGPLVGLLPFAQPPAAVAAPVPGIDGFVPLVPLFEGLSVGEPPIPPLFVREVQAGGAGGSAGTGSGSGGVRWLRCVSGQVATMPLPAVSRPRMRVSWGNLPQAERDAMLLWVRSVTQQGLAPFTLRPEGLGTEGTVVVRAVEPLAIGEQARGIFGTEGVLVETVY